MNRQQRRAKERENQKYAISKSDIDMTVRKSIDKELQQAFRDGIDEGASQALTLMLVLPLKVLMDHYWQKSYAKRLPEFTDYVLEYYEKWQNDELDMDKLKEDLWKYGGVRLEVNENYDDKCL